MSSARGIDHLVVAVDDLGAARDDYDRLGFQTTPMGLHPWGTGNHLVQFPHNFIELVGVVDPLATTPATDAHFSFSAGVKAFLRRRQGMCMLVLSTRDAHADAEEWRAGGLHAYAPYHWSRQATLPDGSESTVAFTLSFVTHPDMAALAFFSCQQHNPEAFWKPQYQSHANGAGSVSAVTLVDDEPARYRAFFSTLLASTDVHERPGAISFGCAGGAVHVLSPRAFQDRYPGVRPVAPGEGAAFRAAALEIGDLDRAAACLEARGVAFTRADGRIWLAEAQCRGLIMELVPTGA